MPGKEKVYKTEDLPEYVYVEILTDEERRFREGWTKGDVVKIDHVAVVSLLNNGEAKIVDGPKKKKTKKSEK